MRNLLTCFGFALALLCSEQSTKGAVVVTLSEVGADVVASGAGTINLDALTFLDSGFASPTLLAADQASIVVGPAGLGDGYADLSGPASFGPGHIVSFATGSGDLFGVVANQLVVPAGYTSGSALSGTATFVGESFASLGVTPGAYVWTWGTGPAADSFTLQIGPTVIPEPGTFGLLALAGVGLIVLRHRVRG